MTGGNVWVVWLRICTTRQLGFPMRDSPSGDGLASRSACFLSQGVLGAENHHLTKRWLELAIGDCQYSIHQRKLIRTNI